MSQFSKTVLKGWRAQKLSLFCSAPLCLPQDTEKDAEDAAKGMLTSKTRQMSGERPPVFPAEQSLFGFSICQCTPSLSRSPCSRGDLRKGEGLSQRTWGTSSKWKGAKGAGVV